MQFDIPTTGYRWACPVARNVQLGAGQRLSVPGPGRGADQRTSGQRSGGGTCSGRPRAEAGTSIGCKTKSIIINQAAAARPAGHGRSRQRGARLRGPPLPAAIGQPPGRQRGARDWIRCRHADAAADDKAAANWPTSACKSRSGRQAASAFSRRRVSIPRPALLLRSRWRDVP